VTLDERKARAIEDMFREGHGLDLISEMGVHHGWTLPSTGRKLTTGGSASATGPGSPPGAAQHDQQGWPVSYHRPPLVMLLQSL
jgi:hypothetical protein